MRSTRCPASRASRCEDRARVLPPILLALLIHGMGHLVEAGLSGRLYRVATTAVAALAVAAGAVSFVALRELALAAGWAPALAWLAPVIVDVPVVVGTAAVVAVDRAAMRQSVTVPDPASAHGGGEVEVDTAPTVAPDPAPSTEVAVEPEATRDMAPRDMAPRRTRSRSPNHVAPNPRRAAPRCVVAPDPAPGGRRSGAPSGPAGRRVGSHRRRRRCGGSGACTAQRR